MGNLRHPVSSLLPRCRIPVRFPSSQTNFIRYIPLSGGTLAPPASGRAAPDVAVKAAGRAGSCLLCRLSNATLMAPFTGSVGFSILPSRCKMGVKISPILHKFDVKWVSKRYNRPGSGQSTLRFQPVLNGESQELHGRNSGGGIEATGRTHAGERGVA